MKRDDFYLIGIELQLISNVTASKDRIVLIILLLVYPAGILKLRLIIWLSKLAFGYIQRTVLIITSHWLSKFSIEQ